MSYRCYHPETGEAFDVPKHRFEDLVLNQGWTQSPPDNAAEPEPVPDRPAPKSRRKRRPIDDEDTAPSHLQPSDEDEDDEA